MAIDQKHIDLLYRAQDDALLPEEKQELALALKHSPKLRDERDKLQRLRSLLAGVPLDESNDFTNQVLAKIQERAVPQRWLQRVAAACLLLIAGAFLTLYLSEGSLSTDTLIGLEELQPEDVMALTGDWRMNSIN